MSAKAQICIVFFLLLILGCGGGTGTATTSQNVELKLIWPEFTGRYIPTYAKSILLELRPKSGGNTYTIVADRPNLTATEQVVRFDNFIPAGQYVLLGVARTEFGGNGQTVASAVVDVNVEVGRRFNASLSLASTISQLAINPSPISVIAGQSTQVSLSAKDPSGNTVFITGGSVTLEVATGADKVRINADGTISGLAAGTATLSATEVGANLVATATVNVLAPVGQDSIWLSIDSLGGAIQKYNVRTQTFEDPFLETNTSTGGNVRLVDIALLPAGWNGSPTPVLIGSSGTSLYQVNTGTGVCTRLGTIPDCNSLCVGPGNRLFAAGGRSVYELTVNGSSVTTRTVSTALPSSALGDMEFDYGTQQVLVACSTALARVYLADGFVESVGTGNWTVTNPFGPAISQQFIGLGYSRGLMYGSMHHYGFSALYRIDPSTRETTYVASLAEAGGQVLGIATIP